MPSSQEKKNLHCSEVQIPLKFNNMFEIHSIVRLHMGEEGGGCLDILF